MKNREMIPQRRERQQPFPSKEIKEEIEKQLFEKQSHSLMKIGGGAYLGDFDKMLETVEKQMPIVNSEQIYMWELEKGERIYLAITVVGLLMVLLGLLI